MARRRKPPVEQPIVKERIKATDGPYVRMEYVGKGRMGITGIYGAVFVGEGEPSNIVVVSRYWGGVCSVRKEWKVLGPEDELVALETAQADYRAAEGDEDIAAAKAAVTAAKGALTEMGY